MNFAKRIAVISISLLCVSSAVTHASGQVPTQWTTIDPAGIGSYNEVAYGDGKFVLAGNQGSNNGPASVTFSSDNGATWSTPVDVGISGKDAGNTRVERFHDRWVISRGNEVWSSTNLTTWTQETVTGVTSIKGSSGTMGLTETFDGTTYKGVYITSTGYAVVESSPGNWAVQSTAGFFPIGGSLTYNGGNLFFVSRTASAATIYKSTDMGTTWTNAPINVSTDMTNKKLFSIKKIGGALWVTGTTGFIAKSTDGGTTWVEKNAPNASLADLWEMDGNSEVLIAMGNGGGSTRGVYSNDDGATWQAIPDGSGYFAQAAWVFIAASPTRLIAGSSSSRIMVGVLPTAPTTTTTIASSPNTPSSNSSSTTNPVTSSSPTAMLSASGEFAHATVDKCQYLSQAGQVTATDVEVDLNDKSIHCGDNADLEIDLRGNEANASAVIAGKLIFYSGKLGIASGTGFKPGSTAEIWVASNPTYLGSTVVKSDGTWEKKFTVPANISAGNHTIQAEGLTPSNSPKAVNAGVRIAKSSILPATGKNTSDFLIYGIFLMFTGITVTSIRRRFL